MLALYIVRPILTLLSLLVLAASIYLLWTWYQGHLVQRPGEPAHMERELWRLIAGSLLIAWSFVGRSLMLWMLSRPDVDPIRPERVNGQMIDGADGARLYVEVHGAQDAPAIILTHGWSLDSTIWFYTRREMAERYRVITWDLPGLGQSTSGDGEITLEKMSSNLAAVVAFAGHPVVLMGHSIGGMTIQTLARTHPGLLRQQIAVIVLINTTHTNPLETIVASSLFKMLRWPVLEPLMRLQIWLQPLAWLSAWQSYLSGWSHAAVRLAFGRHVTRSQLEHTTLLTTRNPPGIIAKGDLAMFRWSATNTLPTIGVPTLVLAGDKDIITLPEAAEMIAASIPAAHLRIIKDVNHMGFLEWPAPYTAAMTDFAALAFERMEPAFERPADTPTIPAH
jgi:pimeloyl-ACP methyl ester carboxylesterase